MQLVYYRKAVPNFGDDLNPFIWQALAPDLFDDESDAGFVGIGTIIGMQCGDLRRLHVFSSGAGNDAPDRWRDRTVRYWCVRGPVSARILGLDADRALTDGAILAPLVTDFPPEPTPDGTTLVIPHWETIAYPGWQQVGALTGFKIVDPRGDPRQIIAAIARSRLVLTESLHGAVLADTYGIPWVAFATSRNFGITKWVDWTLSLGRMFEVTVVPPPDPGPLLAFGRRPEPLGQTVRFDAEAAGQELRHRLAPPRAAGVKSVLKGTLKRSRWLRSMLGYSPARTAEALVRLAGAEGTPTARGVIQDLQSQMLERLACVGEGGMLGD